MQNLGRTKFIALAWQALSLWAHPVACAGEIDGFDGRLESNNSGAKTYTWGLEYREPLTEHFAASFTWLNEGHLPNNHRDGQAVQLWWHSRPDPLGLVFEVGVGPYRYYDTHTLPRQRGRGVRQIQLNRAQRRGRLPLRIQVRFDPG